MFYNWAKYGITVPYGRSGHIRTTCPQCSADRKKKYDKCLSIDLDQGVFHCHNCGWEGSVAEEEEWEKEQRKEQWMRQHKPMKKKPEEYKKPTHTGSKELSEKMVAYFAKRGISRQTLVDLGITEGMEMMPRKDDDQGEGFISRNTIQFNYYLNGELINTKFRTADKKFKMVKDARLIPYNIDSIKGQNYAIITEGECFTPDTEVLTEKGWKRFDELCGDETIAQYEKNGNITFTKPIARIIKPYSGKLVEYSNSRRNYYSLTTPKHNLVVLKDGKPCKIHADEITTRQHNIPRNGYFNGEGLNITDDQLRLYVAISADFTIRKEGDLYAAFKKERKVERIRMLCESIGLRYSINPASRNYYSVFIHRGQGLNPFKEYPMEWLSQLSAHQIDVILSEIIFWDGNSVKGRTMKEYSSKLLNNAVFVQTLCHLGGKMSTICYRSNEYGKWYKVTMLNKTYSTINSYYKKEVDYEGDVYCVSVPSGMLLVRQNNIITISGNCDALSFHEIGYTSVVSVPSGANQNLEWLDDFIEEYFDDKETIYIASDTDAKGVMLKDELVRRFGIERCKVITNYGEGCKDANDVLQKYDKETLKSIIEKADYIPVEGVFAIRDFEKDLDALFEKGLSKGCTMGFPNLDETFSVETKRLMIVTGIPGMGKSEFIDQMAERLNIRYGWKGAFFSPENAPKQLHASKIISKFSGLAFGARYMSKEEYQYTKDYVDNNMYFIFPSDNFKLDNILEKAKYLVRRYGVKMVVIDPYNRLESEQGNQTETKYISELLDKLTNFAQINDVLMVLMAHPAKQHKNENGKYDIPTLYDISGSANFYNKADFGLAVHRDKEEGTTIVSIQKVKFKHLGEPKDVKFKYDLPNGRYIPYTNDLDQYEYSMESAEYVLKYENKTLEQPHDDTSHIGFDRGKGEKYTIPEQTYQPTQIRPNQSFDTPIEPLHSQKEDDAYWRQFRNDTDNCPF